MGDRHTILIGIAAADRGHLPACAYAANRPFEDRRAAVPQVLRDLVGAPRSDESPVGVGTSAPNPWPSSHGCSAQRSRQRSSDNRRPCRASTLDLHENRHFPGHIRKVCSRSSCPRWWGVRQLPLHLPHMGASWQKCANLLATPWSDCLAVPLTKSASQNQVEGLPADEWAAQRAAHNESRGAVLGFPPSPRPASHRALRALIGATRLSGVRGQALACRSSALPAVPLAISARPVSCPARTRRYRRSC